MRITALIACSKKCVYQKDGFCRADRSNIKSNCLYTTNQTGFESESYYTVNSDRCLYFKKDRMQKRSDSKLEAFFI